MQRRQRLRVIPDQWEPVVHYGSFRVLLGLRGKRYLHPDRHPEGYSSTDHLPYRATYVPRRKHRPVQRASHRGDYRHARQGDYRDRTPDSFTVQPINRRLPLFREIEVLLKREVTVDGQGHQLKEYLLTLNPDPDEAIAIQEKLSDPGADRTSDRDLA